MILVGFWGLFWRQLAPFSLPEKHYDTDDIDTFISALFTAPDVFANEINIVHFLDPTCPCYRFAVTYVKQLIKKKTPYETHYLLLKTPDYVNWQATAEHYRLLSRKYWKESVKFLPSTPALLIHQNHYQKFAYFGPHSDGLTCGTGKGYVPLIVANLRAGFNNEFLNLDGFGCFCSV